MRQRAAPWGALNTQLPALLERPGSMHPTLWWCAVNLLCSSECLAAACDRAHADSSKCGGNLVSHLVVGVSRLARFAHRNKPHLP